MEMKVALCGNSTSVVSFDDGITETAMVNESANEIVTDAGRVLSSAQHETTDVTLSSGEQMEVEYASEQTLPFSFSLNETFEVELEETE